MGYIYIASPYSHPDAEVRHERYSAAQRYLVHLLQERRWAFSPIVHCHDAAMKYDLPRDHEFWLDFDAVLLRRASEMHILCIEGWQESKGIAHERLFARMLELPVRYSVFAPDLELYEEYHSPPPS